MEKIDATYLSSFTFASKKWGEIKKGFTHFANGDVAFAKITPCFQNRKSMILKDLPNGVGAGTTELRVLRRYGNTIILEYLLFFLESPYFVDEATFKGTANQQRIITGYLEKKLFPLPPLAEQKRIVEMILQLFPVVARYEKSENKLNLLNNNIKPYLEKSILQEAIQGRLVDQCETDESASVLLEKIRVEKKRLFNEGKLKKSALEDSVIFKGDDNKYFEKRGKELVCIDDEIPFEIPNSWEWVRFGSIINMRMGKTPARGDVDYWTNGKTPWVSISDMFDYGIITNTKEKVSDFAIQTAFGGNIVPKGTLIMSFKLTVGRTSLLDIDAVHNEAIISIIPYFDKKDSLRDYLFYVLPLISNFGDSKDAIKGKTLNSTSLFNLLIPLPPIADQRRIVNAIVTAWQVL